MTHPDPARPPAQRRMAAIDIGSNSVHMVIAEVDATGTVQIVDREKDMVKLGAGSFETRRLSEEAMVAALEALKRYAAVIDGADVDDRLVVATSASREADNGEAFLASVRAETNLDPKVISGTEEGRLIFGAVRHALDLDRERVLVIDIGGGSVEMVVGSDRGVALARSLGLGVQRLLGRIGKRGKLKKKEMVALAEHVREVAGDVVEQARAIGFERVVGTSGTIKALGEAAHLRGGGKSWRTPNAERVDRAALIELRDGLRAMRESERAAVAGIDASRADAIHLGAVLLTTLLEMLGANTITLCDASLREGVLLDRIAPLGRRLPEQVSTSERAVRALMRKYQVDEPRADHVAWLATRLFEDTAAVHQLPLEAREILVAAARLHAVGQFVHFKRYHKHSRYIIRQSRLRGFPERSVDLIAHTARYHRRALPRKGQKKFGRLDEEGQRTVAVLAGLLRVALGLDRRHAQSVTELGAHLTDETLTIQAGGAEDLTVELHAAEQQSRLLAKRLGRTVRFERMERAGTLAASPPRRGGDAAAVS